MKRTIKFSIVLIILVSSILLLMGGKSQAILQANSTTHATPVNKTGAAWITAIRQMETSGQTMGLTETLDGLNATSESNNVDVHMMLPTEYGAIAILSASGYGNPGMLQDEEDVQKRTTTGNTTGVYFTGNRWEALADTQLIAKSKYNSDNDGIGSIVCSNSSAGWHSGMLNRMISGVGSKNVSYFAGGAGLHSSGYFASNTVAGSRWNSGSDISRGSVVVASGI